MPPVSPETPPPSFGFVENAERLNSRAAMVTLSLHNRLNLALASHCSTEARLPCSADWLLFTHSSGSHSRAGAAGDGWSACGEWIAF